MSYSTAKSVKLLYLRPFDSRNFHSNPAEIKPMATQILYRVGQAAKDCGVSSYRIRRLCETGLINAEFTGNQWQIPAAEVERLKRNGVPSAPKIVDSDDAEASRAPNAKERAAPTLLAEPSPEMVAAAEEAEMSGRQLTVARNKLEQNRARREEAEIYDFFAERAKRLQEQEAEEQKRYQEQLDTDGRKRDQAAAVERREQFYSRWIEYALEKRPVKAPAETELDIHAEVLSALATVDAAERDSVVQRLVDGAVDRGLKPWKAREAKRAAIELAIAQLPYSMRYNESWKWRAQKAASEALADVRPGATKEEMEPLARAGLQPLVAEYERAGKIEEAINSIHIDGATYDELRDARESVREALDALPQNATAKQIAQAKEQTLTPISARIAERLVRMESQCRRERVLAPVDWRLPSGISESDREDARREIKEALNELPDDASEREMEKVRDAIILEYEREYEEKARRAEKKAAQVAQKARLVQAGLNAIRPYAEVLVRQYDYDPGQTTWDIDTRVRGEVHKALEEELTGRETEQEVGRIVREVMRDLEGCR
jgi:hypothetical protein